MVPVCLERTAMGAADRRHHTRMILSVDPAAIIRLSSLTAMSEISELAPRKVNTSLPEQVSHILTRRSSAPVNT